MPLWHFDTFRIQEYFTEANWFANLYFLHIRKYPVSNP